jgi:uncharacterized protein YciI
VEFDTFTITLLLLRPDYEERDAETEAALQDAHLNHLAELHEAGYVLAAGPLLGDATYRGLSILRVPPDEARRLKETDPAVLAGRYSLVVLPWLVPGGAVSFSPTRFPHSAAEAQG